MIILFCFSCTSSSSMNEQNAFSPALVGIVESLKWQYTSNCTGIEARWLTTLPSSTNVQIMIGPKNKNPHFDNDALFTRDTTVNDKGEVNLTASRVLLPSQTTFINLRVWGNTPEVYDKLSQSQKKGGFPIAQSPDGPYAWAETTIPPCE